MAEGDRTPPAGASALVSVRCPDCGRTVYSPQLSRDELLERHRRYCAGAPAGQGDDDDPDDDRDDDGGD